MRILVSRGHMTTWSEPSASDSEYLQKASKMSIYIYTYLEFPWGNVFGLFPCHDAVVCSIFGRLARGWTKARLSNP